MKANNNSAEKEEDFILPEFWGIECTDENREVLNKWRLSKATAYTDDTYFNRGCALVSVHPWGDGSYYYGGGARNLKDLYPQYEFITFDQFKKYVLKQEDMKEQTGVQYATREQLKMIHDAVCEGWKEKILQRIKEYPFEEKIPVNDSEILRGLSDANEYQKNIILGIFKQSNYGVFKGDISLDVFRNFKNEIFKDPHMFGILDDATPEDRPELRGQAFFITSDHNVEIGRTEGGGTFISITKK